MSLIFLGILTAGNTSAAFQTVATNAADNFTISSAQLNGDLKFIWDEDSSEVWFEWGTTTDYGNSTVHVAKPTKGVFSEVISGISPTVTYHFRAAAFYSHSFFGDRTVYGDDESFNVSIPVVATDIAEDVTSDSANLTGNLIDLGIFGVDTDVWFEWGTTDSYGNNTAVITKSNVGTFSAGISGLSEGESYHFRTVASNIYGTVYGNGLVFISLGSGNWARTFTPGGTGSFQQAVGGGYLSAPGHLLKLDSVGNPDWAKDFIVAGCDDIAFNIPEPITGGEYIITASCFVGTSSSPLIIKTDSTFTPLQAKTFTVAGYSDIKLVSIQETNGGYIILATHDQPIDPYHSNDTFFIIKIDSDFNELWANKYTEIDFSGIVLRQTSDNGYIVAGEINVTDSLNQIFIARFDANGVRLWANIYSGYDSTDNLTFTSIHETAEGGCIVTGDYNAGASGYNALLLKVGSNGAKDWAREYASPGTESDVFSDVQQTVDGGYIVVGNYREPITFKWKGFIIKANSSGNKVWAKEYGTSGAVNDYFYSIEQTTDGGYLIRGGTMDADANYRTTLVKTNSAGEISSCSLLQDLNTISVVGGGFGNIYSAGAAPVSPVSSFVASTTPSVVSSDVFLMPDDICCNGGVIPPAVLTDPETNVTISSVQLNGRLTDLGSDIPVDIWFEWEETAVEPAIYSNSTVVIATSSIGAFSAGLSGLTSGTDYYFRAVVQNTTDTIYGNGEPFTTAIPNINPNAASVSDDPDPVDVGNDVTFTGNWTEPNSGDDVKMYICKDAACNNCNNTVTTSCWCYSSAWNTEPDVTDTCSYTAQVADEGITYDYWLGVCDDDNACDTVALPNETFTINILPGNVPPTVLTTPEASTTTNSAQLNGQLTNLGGDPSANVWFEWEESAVEPAIYTNTLASPGSPKGGPDTFFATLLGLDPDTDYYYRAVAQNTIGTTRGDGEHFITADVVVVAPNATSLSCTGDTKEMYCLNYADITGNVVGGRDGAVDFFWTYDHPDGLNMKNFLFQAAVSPFPTADLVVNVNIPYPAIDGATIATTTNVCSETSCGTVGSDELTYDQNYYWQVKVCDVNDVCSDWIEDSMQVQTPNHRAPKPNFSWTVLEPAVNRTAQFCSVKEGDCSAMLDIDKSVCYNTSDQPISCSAATFKWTIPASAEFVSSTVATDANPKIKFTELGTSKVILEITGSGPCAECKSMKVTSYPKWIEDDPFK